MLLPTLPDEWLDFVNENSVRTKMVLDDRNTENQNILYERPKVIKLVSTLSVDLVVLIHAFTVIASKSRTWAQNEPMARLSQ
jgi:hypothetical protein